MALTDDPGLAAPNPHLNGGGSAPPHNLEAEQSVLGAILLSERSLYALVIEEGLRPEDFYRDRHRITYAAMLRLYAINEPIDPLTVTEALRQSGELEAAGGAAAIDELTASVPLVGNARRYAQIVKENALLRRLLQTTYEIQASVAEHRMAPRDLVEQAEKAMLEVAHDDKQQDFRSIEEILHDELDKMQRLSAEGTALTGTPSGFKDLDEITGGFQPGNLIILAARPSMGKCLGSETLVYDPRTGLRRRIADVVADGERGEEVWVAAVGADLKLRPAKVSHVMRSGVQRVHRLRTRLGRTVRATANHPFLTTRGWQPLGELRPGDRLAVPRVLPRPAASASLPDHEIVLLAALIADGDLTNRTPRFTSGPRSPVLATVAKAAAAMGVRLRDDGRGTASISAGRGAASDPVTDLRRRHGIWGKRAEHTRVPDAIFALDDDQVARFLAVLYACAGHVHTSDRLCQVGYTTISEGLARDVQHLLLRLGVVAAIRTLPRPVDDGTGKTAYEVRITDREQLRTFCRRVPVVGEQEQVARAVARLESVRARAYLDTIPEAWSQVIAVKRERTRRSLTAATGRPADHDRHAGRRAMSGHLLQDIAPWAQDPAPDLLAGSDVWWDEVASIEDVGEEETYDLTVPGDHNFVADDVIVHNSALVTNIAENAAIEYNRPVALFSLEMSETELAQRFVASQGRIFGDKLRKGRVADSEWPKILEATKKLSAAPLYVDDSSDIGILDIRAKARRLHQQAPGGLGLIIVDYLQLMRPDPGTDSRVEQVGQMSRGLKILARELNVPVIALSQLSRAVEQRHDKKPILSDLRECVTGDTLVQLADGRRTPIRDLVGTTPEVVAVDERGRTVTAASDCVWRVGRRRVLALRLASGRTLRATADHRVRAYDGWRRMESLAPGDRVALARRIPEPTETIEWPDDHVVLLGQLIGDGSYLSGTRWAPAGVNAWLRDLGIFGQRSHEKRVPAEAFRLADRQIALLLRHLWATDGSIWDGTRASDGRSIRRVAYSTISPGLASDVAALLLRLGIVARINVSASRGEHRPTHHVLVSGADAQLRFLETVGTFGPRVAQGERLRAALAGRRATTNVDTLPREAWAGVRTAMAAQGVTQRRMAALRGTAYGGAAHFAFAPSRETLLGYAELLDDDTLRDAAGSDLFWDRVVAVEDAGEEDVYDLTVPGPSCWLADGIVTHNSGQIEQDADLVMFIYRDEYYEKDESEAQGLAEILIAKHRNGGLGDVTLTFRKEYPKFLNYAGERYQ